MIGIEPMILCVQSIRSTTKPHPQNVYYLNYKELLKIFFINNAKGLSINNIKNGIKKNK